MVIGSVWGLTHTCRRLVLVARVPAEQITDHAEVDNGGVTLTHLEPSQITAWFADDDDAHARGAAEAVKGMTIDDAWNDVTSQTLIGEHELSWHDVTEELPAVSTDPVGFRGLVGCLPPRVVRCGVQRAANQSLRASCCALTGCLLWRAAAFPVFRPT
ncbi:DUF6912 family protein, partial [Listeria monocytogenes]|uniref:DUF6912 family protein n=1 Tax=Listeria monocytogenes TaxID=1639 RepID=UPI003F75EBB0